MTPRHRDTYDRAQAAWEKKQIAEQLHDIATTHLGDVAAVSTSRLLDLREEDTHIHQIRVDSTRLERGPAFRVRVEFAAIGNESNVRNHPEVDADGPLDAGSIQPSEVPPYSRKTHMEFVIADGCGIEECRENVNDYIQTHWDPRWMGRERITPEDTRGGE